MHDDPTVSPVPEPARLRAGRGVGRRIAIGIAVLGALLGCAYGAILGATTVGSPAFVGAWLFGGVFGTVFGGLAGMVAGSLTGFVIGSAYTDGVPLSQRQRYLAGRADLAAIISGGATLFVLLVLVGTVFPGSAVSGMQRITAPVIGPPTMIAALAGAAVTWLALARLLPHHTGEG